MTQLTLPILALLTDRTRLQPNWTLAQAAAPAVTGGVNLVVFRETDLPIQPRLAVARFLRDGVHGRAPLVWSGEPGPAKQAGFDGVHGPEDAKTDRTALWPGALLGVTVDYSGDAGIPADTNCDYVLAMFDWSHPDVLVQITGLCSRLAAPVIAGTDPPLELVPGARRAGTAGVALCVPIMAGPDRTAVARSYRAALERS